MTHSPNVWPAALDDALHRDLPVNVLFALALVLGPTIFRGGAARTRATALIVAWVGYVVWISV